MTAPVTTAAAPAARPTPTSDPGGTDSAEPFASALDGALASHAEIDSAGAQGGGDGATDQEESGAATGTPGEPAASAPNGVVALWALLTGTAATATAADSGTTGVPGAGTPVAAGHAAGTTPPGLAVASVRAAGVAHGLQAKLAAEASPISPDGTGAGPAPVVPGTGRPPTPPPAAAAARAAAEALAAAGVQQIVTETTATGTDDAVAVPPPTAGAPVAAPSTGDGGPTPAPAPASGGSLPVAAAQGSGGTTADRGPGDGEDAPTRTDAAPTTGQAAPTASTAPVARSEGATGAAVAQPVSGQIAQRIAVLRGGPDGSHTMTVVLTPENLGPVEVSVTVSRGTVELTLRGAHEHGRAALLDAVPDLRRDLEAAGLTCSRLDVDRGGRDGAWSSSQQQAGRPGEQGPGGRGSQHDRSDGGARPWHRSADTGEGPRATSRTASGLDVRV